MQRYSIIKDKNPREIVLLRGTGCRYRRCAFCDYHEDASTDETANTELNLSVLQKVTGQYGVLEVINSGSFIELGEDTINQILKTCILKNITQVHFECHWIYRHHIAKLRQLFHQNGIIVIIKTGVETFDNEYREKVMLKGIKETDPAKIAEIFDECCLLFGLPGQNKDTMIKDLETGLKHFKRVCINIMTPNTAPLQPDNKVRKIFIDEVYPLYCNNERVDILLNNTDFGVGCINS